MNLIYYFQARLVLLHRKLGFLMNLALFSIISKK
jgi:hypothetical protein